MLLLVYFYAPFWNNFKLLINYDYNTGVLSILVLVNTSNSSTGYFDVSVKFRIGVALALYTHSIFQL